MKIIILTLLIVNLTQASSMHSLRGGIDGGGADQYQNEFGSAWFLKGYKASIDICVSVNDSLSLSQAKVKETVSMVYKQWDQYIKANVVYEEDEPEEMEIETSIKFVDNCKVADLEIYVGIENERLNRIRSRFNKPLAFAHREAYDSLRGWSKGVVWLSDKNPMFESPSSDIWSFGNNLYMILLHELGHTFGNSHKPFTIMERDITNRILTYEPDESDKDDYYEDILKKQKKIDWESSVVPCFECILSGSKGSMWLGGSNHENLTFNLLFNRDPVGKVETQYFVSYSDKLNTFSGKLTVKDALEEKSFPLRFNFSSISMKADPFFAFSRYRKFSQGNYQGSQSIQSGGLSLANIYGYIEINDKRFNVILENEMFSVIISPPIGENEKNSDVLLINDSPRSIYLLNNGEKHYLYSNVKKYEFESDSKACSLEKALGFSF